MVAGDVAGVFERLITAVADDRFHSEIAEASRVEHGGAVARVREDGGQRAAFDFFIGFRAAVEGGKGGAEDGEQSFDAFRVDRVGIFEDERTPRQRGEIGHRVGLAAVEREILGGGGFQADHHDVESTGGSGITGEIFGVAVRGGRATRASRSVRRRAVARGRRDCRLAP